MYFFIYETKNLSLEEVDQLYQEVSSARKSTAWQPTITFKARADSVAQNVMTTGHKEEAA